MTTPDLTAIEATKVVDARARDLVWRREHQK